MRDTGATYLSSLATPQSNEVSVTAQAWYRALVIAICGVLSLLVLSSTLTISTAPTTDYSAFLSGVADESEEKMNEVLGEVPEDSDEADDLLIGSADSSSIDSEAGAAEGLKYVVWRIFHVGYINNVQKASTPDDDGGNDLLADHRVKDGDTKKWACNAKNTSAGTLSYHNCDIPVFFTEALQGIITNWLPTGIIGGETQSAHMGNWSGAEGNDRPFGLSYYTPANINTDKNVKYTALELYGYNLKYTRYYGETDQIKVYTSARALANFGTFDKLGVALEAAFDGAKAYADQASKEILGTAQAWGAKVPVLGHIVGGTWGAIKCVFGSCPSASLAAVVRRLMDTSDYNVIRSGGWYRPTFGQTLYGARELTESEIGDIIIEDLLAWLQKTAEENYEVPESWDAIQTQIEMPKISKCSMPGIDSWESTLGTNKWSGISIDTPMGTLADCEAYLATKVTEDTEINANFTAGESLEAWADRTWRPAHTEYQGTEFEFCVEDNKNNTNVAISDWSNYLSQVEKIRNCITTEGTQAKIKFLASNTDLAAAYSFDKLAGMYGGEVETIESKTSEIMGNFMAADARYVCVNENGEDLVGNGIGKDKYVFLYKKANAGSTGAHWKVNPECLAVNKAYRAPIQGAMFGSGYESKQPNNTGNPVDDPRREQWSWQLFEGSIGNAFASTGLKISGVSTRAANTMLNLSMSPLMDTVGITDLVVDGINALRDSVFYPLVIIVLGLAGISILFGAMKNRNYLQQFKNVLMIFGVFFVAVMVLERPAQFMDLIDKAPAKVEAVIVGSIFEVDESENRLCSASDAAGATEGWEPGDTLPYSYKAGSRVMLCEVWKTFYFNPYVMNQWGTSYGNLSDYAMENDNSKLVGNAKVEMGAGIIERNWALYQVDSMLSGTTSTQDLSAKTPSKGIDPNMYRIVDMMFHPDYAAWADKTGADINNSVKSIGAPDSRYAADWAGANSAMRGVNGIMSGTLAVFGAVVIIAFAFAKILVTLQLSLLLLLLPIVLLFGLFPNSGFNKLKGYIGEILSLMIQRFMYTVLLALMLRIMAAAGASTDNILMYYVIMFAILLGFWVYRKELIELFSGGPKDAFGTFSNSIMEKGSISQALPMSVRNQAAIIRSGVTGGVTGAVGGFAAGGLKGARQGSQDNWNRLKEQTTRAQRRAGTGMFQGLNDGKRAGEEAGKSQVAKHLNKHGIETQELLDKEFMIDTSGDVDSQQVEKLLEDGKITPRDLRDSRRLAKALQKKQKKENKVRAKVNGSDYDALSTSTVDSDKPQFDFAQYNKDRDNVESQVADKTTKSQKKLDNKVKRIKVKNAVLDAPGQAAGQVRDIAKQGLVNLGDKDAMIVEDMYHRTKNTARAVGRIAHDNASLGKAYVKDFLMNEDYTPTESTLPREEYKPYIMEETEQGELFDMEDSEE